MAGQTISDVWLQGVKGAVTQIVPPVPAGKAESVCLVAAMNDPARLIRLCQRHPDGPDRRAGYSIPIIYNEPVRYRQPGGSPVLLQNFILPAGASLSVAETTGSAFGLDVTANNRWRFDAVRSSNGRRDTSNGYVFGGRPDLERDRRRGSGWSLRAWLSRFV